MSFLWLLNQIIKDVVASNNRHGFAHSSGGQEFRISIPGLKSWCQRGGAPSVSRGESVGCLLQLLVVVGIPWFVVTSPQSLALPSHSLSSPRSLLSLCFSLTRVLCLHLGPTLIIQGHSATLDSYYLLTSSLIDYSWFFMLNLKILGAKSYYYVHFRDKELSQVMYIYTAGKGQLLNSVPSVCTRYTLKENEESGTNLTK